MISELHSEHKTLAEKVKSVYSVKTNGGDINFEETFPQYSEFLKDFNPDEISPEEVDRLLKISESDEFLKEMTILNNTDYFQDSRLKRYL